MMKKLQFLCFTLFLFSCVQSPTSPEGVLTNFVNERFEGKTLESLKEHLSPNYYQEMNTVQSEGFKKLENLKKKKFKIISKSCDEQECRITYFVSYVTVKNGNQDFETETKKIASLTKNEKDLWEISKIDHVKTYHDMVKKIDVTE
jgi:hypothetical protein